jgi:hypothetical protein
MRGRSAVIATALLLVVSFATPASAITNGVPDSGRHPYVGLLVFDYEGVPAWRCSGALIAPRLVLTAGHCTDGADGARIWFSEDIAADPNANYPSGGAGSSAVEGTPHTHPDYGPGPYGGGNGLPAFAFRDVGVVVLDEPVSGVGMAALPSAGLVKTLKNKTGIDVVGYGVQYQDKIKGSEVPQPPPYFRWKGPRVRLLAKSELVSGRFVQSPDYMRLSMNPGRGKGGTCFGDSGGPDLLGGTNVVLAVNSFVTNVNCKGVGYSSRVDKPAVLSWIASKAP